MALEVTAGFDADRWGGLAADSPYHDAGWLTAMTSRLPGAVYTVLDRRGIGFVGVLVDDPDCYEAYNPQAILWRDPPVFELTDPAGRAAELARHRTPNSLPALVLVAPGYHGDPAGPAGNDPAVLAECLAELLGWCRRHRPGRAAPAVHRQPGRDRGGGRPGWPELPADHPLDLAGLVAGLAGLPGRPGRQAGPRAAPGAPAGHQHPAAGRTGSATACR